MKRYTPTRMPLPPRWDRGLLWLYREPDHKAAHPVPTGKAKEFQREAPVIQPKHASISDSADALI
jgi:hypothetical protein